MQRKYGKGSWAGKVLGAPAYPASLPRSPSIEYQYFVLQYHYFCLTIVVRPIIYVQTETQLDRPSGRPNRLWALLFRANWGAAGCRSPLLIIDNFSDSHAIE